MSKYLFYKLLNRIFKKANFGKLPIQLLKNPDNLTISSLGSSYGAWTFIESDNLFNSTIISAGLGEDASFDIEFASKYNATVILVDPTPKAIDHFNQIKSSIGNEKSTNYPSHTGKMPIESYDLTKIKKEQLILIPKALWNKETILKFFKPKNKEHVSHSIINFQNNYRKDTEYIEVKSTTTSKIMNDLKIKNLELIKLDIEGAESVVIKDLIKSNIKPNQILVEYDELNKPNNKVVKKINEIHEFLESNNYQCVYTNGASDFLYILN